MTRIRRISADLFEKSAEIRLIRVIRVLFLLSRRKIRPSPLEYAILLRTYFPVTAVILGCAVGGIRLARCTAVHCE